jgi:NADH-quinone oxidoreductase subunit A
MTEFPLVGYILLFVAVGVGFIVVNLLVGKVVRPNRPEAEKGTIYECGEPTIGSAWVQFDLRFYVVALLFVIFDVEVAFFFPWAVVFGQSTQVAQVQDYDQLSDAEKAKYRERLRDLSAAGARPAPESMTANEVRANATAAGKLAWIAFFDILVFFGVLLVGFAYLWKRGDLQWVRAVHSDAPARIPQVQQPESSRLVGTGS